MSRKNARESVLKLVFEYLFLGERNDDTLNLALENCVQSECDYVKNLYEGVINNFDRYKAEVTLYSRDFSFERIYKVDLSILLISMYEIEYCEDIPYQVSINEAVELAKLYSTEKSSAYINGILASVIRSKGGEPSGIENTGRQTAIIEN